MIFALVLMMSTALLNAKPTPVFTDVYIGDSGPYRFLVDTGSQTSIVDAALAGKLHLKPEFRIELMTQQSTELVPGAKLTNLRLRYRALPDTEVVFRDVSELRSLDPALNGILGLNALATFDYTLSPPTGRLEETAERPDGEVVPFVDVDGRIAIKARMGDETLTLLLDSGANHMVLFRLPAAMAKVRAVPTTIATLEGARRTVPTCWSADMLLGNLRIGTLPAAIVQTSDEHAEGLLPASIFKKIHVDQARHELVLVR